MSRARATVARLAMFVVFGVTVLGVQAARAQGGTGPAEQALSDFIHFVKIANYEAAGANGQSLIDHDLSPVEFVELIERSGELKRFEEAVAGAMRVPTLEPVAAAMERTYRQGKLMRARDPVQVAENIALLEQGLRAKQIGRERLSAAGEYAVPQLLDAFLARGNPSLKAEVQRLLIDMGRQSIMPLCTALPSLDPVRQEQVVEVLGLIKYRTSLPFLTELYQTTDTDSVRSSCARAIERLEGDANADIAELFFVLADSFYFERPELTSFAGEDHQLLWEFDPGIGLLMNAIRTEIFHEAMAMRMSEHSLQLDPTSEETLALWLAANFSREIDTPEGYDNPAYAEGRRDAEYFAVGFGPKICQLVLRRALDSRDTPLARRAIASIERTAGARSLWRDSHDGRRPLLEALSYPNRRVQYETALALGSAQPLESFPGAERVVPFLASAIRDASAQYAVVLTGRNREEYDRIRGDLEARGYQVLPPADNGLSDIAAPIAEAPGIDLMVTSLDFDQARDAIDEARSSDRLSVAPVLVLMDPERLQDMTRQFRRDQTVMVRRSSIDGSQFGASLDQLVRVASGGPITDQEAEAYANRALAVLRDLAVSRNTTLNVADAALPLMTVLADNQGQRLMDVAEVLSFIDQERTQTALMDRVLSLDEDTQVRLLSKVASSAKRHGNMLPDRLVRALLDLARSSDDDLATAAAAAMGALSLPNADLLPLVLQTEPQQAAAAGQ